MEQVVQAKAAATQEKAKAKADAAAARAARKANTAAAKAARMEAAAATRSKRQAVANLKKEKTAGKRERKRVPAIPEVPDAGVVIATREVVGFADVHVHLVSSVTCDDSS
ncbi:hypothetical protein PHYPSEUDO_007266 [Phytophthora pseudosyringae]|uniref:Uncharacterized protein n=1 Tax=Phytophthora pseudosyringae TaxID=221518 RepID=A0A8T1VJM6_9STRA|nr:hypothetical protein PHYPSEUDO_007266 [Phytophthora pseudosyringae]